MCVSGVHDEGVYGKDSPENAPLLPEKEDNAFSSMVVPRKGHELFVPRAAISSTTLAEAANVRY